MMFHAIAVAPDVQLRPVAEDDSAALLRAFLRNREHLRRWDPRRDEEFFTPAGQAARLRDQLEQRETGRQYPYVLTHAEEIIGAVTLSNVVRGPLHSANLGYWIDAGHVGRGLAGAAVTLVARAADQQHGLHRLEAGAATDNPGSQRVLVKSGFQVIGTAPKFLLIDGEWRDHVLFQKILNDRHPG
ncbi:GNAT family N-acetyltransferase [Kitasatospora sp. NPDC048540]|uniref:GNAT family N-acetyltransferase n=1 Tax=Kitasatospora sp. NPDC048540 TaxID=3155634 RepID=UPI0033E1A69A